MACCVLYFVTPKMLLILKSLYSTTVYSTKNFNQSILVYIEVQKIFNLVLQ